MEGTMRKKSKRSKTLAWHVVEKAILKEMRWLEKTLPIHRWGEDYRLLDWCYRRLALWIVKGNVKIIEYNAKKPAKDLFNGLLAAVDDPIGIKEIKTGTYHGNAWHRMVMDALKSYFERDGYEVIIEPDLHFGRADLGAYKDNLTPLYIEVGNVSLPKLEVNLRTMPKCTFLLVPDTKKIIEIISLLDR